VVARAIFLKRYRCSSRIKKSVIRSNRNFNDINIAVYTKKGSNPLSLSADLKIDLSENTGRPPDRFDVRVINHLLTKGDLFSFDDEKLIENIKTGLNDFDHFVGETEAYLTTQDSKL
jgi:hypothetical protein